MGLERATPSHVEAGLRLGRVRRAFHEQHHLPRQMKHVRSGLAVGDLRIQIRGDLKDPLKFFKIEEKTKETTGKSSKILVSVARRLLVRLKLLQRLVHQLLIELGLESAREKTPKRHPKASKEIEN